MKIEINPSVVKEFEYIVEMHKKHGAPNEFGTVSELISYVLSSIADGSRRPGSWERQLLLPMGLVAQTEEHEVYRSFYGAPTEEVEAQQ
ncbi:hypothetical protein [Microbulbifer epialgicus]|uniref:Uncharacterized protein n=1 Tax=Microbulbifer epialgicus TaxID=393907 RepID=A0ABV4NUU8_9GAMM